MDIRAIIAGTLSLVALVGLIVLQAIGRLDAGAAGILSSLASGGMTYALGLYSSAFDAPVALGDVDEPAGVTRAGEHGIADPLGIIALGTVLAWITAVAHVIVAVVNW